MGLDHAGQGSDGAWLRFQSRLADALDDLADDDFIHIEVLTGLTGSRGHGLKGRQAPAFDLVTDGEALRAQVTSNHFLDPRFALSPQQMAALEADGWFPPKDETDYFQIAAARCQVDYLALRIVTVLRDLLAVPHPAFLDADGLERDPGDPSRTEVVPPTAPMEKGPEQEPVLLPKDGDELQVMVDEAVAAFLDQDDVEHDDDGDIPIAASGLTLLVSASDERPMIELRCRLVTGVRGLERALMELDLLNRAHPFAKFHLEDDGVLMVQLVAAAPFVPMQLRVALRTMMTGLDDLARELAARVGGRPNIAAPARMVTRQTLHLDELHEGMVALLELLREHPVSTLAVTTLFSDSRRTITDQIVAVRLGRIDCGDVEPDVVLSHLRRALHRVVGVEVARRRAGKRQPRSQQLSLLPTSEETLDEGDWDTETA